MIYKKDFYKKYNRHYFKICHFIINFNIKQKYITKQII